MKNLDPAIRNFFLLQRILLDKGSTIRATPGEVVKKLHQTASFVPGRSVRPRIGHVTSFDQSAGDGSRRSGRTLNEEAAQAKQNARYLRNAKVISIPPELYIAFYRTFDKYTTEELAGLKYDPGVRDLDRHPVRGPPLSSYAGGKSRREESIQDLLDIRDASREELSDPSLPKTKRAQLNEMVAEIRDGNMSFDKYAGEMRRLEKQARGLSLLDIINREGTKLPLPDLMPFDTFFLSLEEGVAMNELTLSGRLRPDLVKELISRSETDYGVLLGYLVVRGKLISDFVMVPNIRGAGNGEEPGTAYFWQDLWTGDPRHTTISHQQAAMNQVGWHHCFSLDPWIVPALIEYVSSHRTITKQPSNALSYRLAVKRYTKKEGLKGCIPPMYYKVHLETHLVEQVIETRVSRETNRPGRPKSFQSDVREHERVLYRRGPMPLSDADREKLIKRRYRVYEGEALSDDDANRLAEREILNKTDAEWIAIRHTVIVSHKSPCDRNASERGLVYVPALRTLDKHRRVRQSKQPVELAE